MYPPWLLIKVALEKFPLNKPDTRLEQNDGYDAERGVSR